MLKLDRKAPLNLHDFHYIVFGNGAVSISQDAVKRMCETRAFIQYLLDHDMQVYGLTTGFADLRACAVSAKQAGELSHNIISSHDAGIGKPFPQDVVLGAMLLRANSLVKGHSGCQVETLETLTAMINHRIIPAIPETGSLGASGDLAFLARLGRAMEGCAVPVYYQGETTDAATALKQAGITPFHPAAKEGLALTNGTSFMISMAAIAFLRQVQELENILAYQGLFLNAVGAVDAAFNGSIQQARGQAGQSYIAAILSKHLAASPFINRSGIQDDYCIRCLPQILGPKIESILEQERKIVNEMNAATDNPLLFKEDEITDDVAKERKLAFNGQTWTVLSGGNFHGEVITSIADTCCAANAKIMLTLERQFTYLLNPRRNGGILPPYLIYNSDQAGLLSGYMITQYTANALVQKIAHLGSPCAMFNITSANESEDVVSYGATAAGRWLEQIALIHQFNTVYLSALTQAYAIARKRKVGLLDETLLCERMFTAILQAGSETYPVLEDKDFAKRYAVSSSVLNSGALRRCLNLSLIQKGSDAYTHTPPAEAKDPLASFSP